MAVLFVSFRNKFRKLIDGAGERCPDCGRPVSYRIDGSDFTALNHRCRNRRPGRIKQDVLDDGENDQDDEDLCEGARIERGFAMLEMADDLEYACVGVY